MPPGAIHGDGRLCAPVSVTVYGEGKGMGESIPPDGPGIYSHQNLRVVSMFAGCCSDRAVGSQLATFVRVQPSGSLAAWDGGQTDLGAGANGSGIYNEDGRNGDATVGLLSASATASLLVTAGRVPDANCSEPNVVILSNGTGSGSLQVTAHSGFVADWNVDLFLDASHETASIGASCSPGSILQEQGASACIDLFSGVDVSLDVGGAVSVLIAGTGSGGGDMYAPRAGIGLSRRWPVELGRAEDAALSSEGLLHVRPSDRVLSYLMEAIVTWASKRERNATGIGSNTPWGAWISEASSGTLLQRLDIYPEAETVTSQALHSSWTLPSSLERCGCDPTVGPCEPAVQLSLASIDRGDETHGALMAAVVSWSMHSLASRGILTYEVLAWEENASIASGWVQLGGRVTGGPAGGSSLVISAASGETVCIALRYGQDGPLVPQEASGHVVVSLDGVEAASAAMLAPSDLCHWTGQFLATTNIEGGEYTRHHLVVAVLPERKVGV